jgi:hypothetical protein
MKYILVALLLCASHNIMAQSKPKAVKDSIDNRMKGPNGQPIVIGKNGGRYYWQEGKKVYVEFKGNNKKPKAKKD